MRCLGKSAWDGRSDGELGWPRGGCNEPISRGFRSTRLLAVMRRPKVRTCRPQPERRCPAARLRLRGAAVGMAPGLGWRFGECDHAGGRGNGAAFSHGCGRKMHGKRAMLGKRRGLAIISPRAGSLRAATKYTDQPDGCPRRPSRGGKRRKAKPRGRGPARELVLECRMFDDRSPHPQRRPGLDPGSNSLTAKDGLADRELDPGSSLRSSGATTEGGRARKRDGRQSLAAHGLGEAIVVTPDQRAGR